MAEAAPVAEPYVDADGKLTARGQSLVAENAGLAGAVAKRYAARFGVRDYHTYQDLCSETLLGLCIAATTFDESRAKFSTHGTWGAIGRASQHLRRRPQDAQRGFEEGIDGCGEAIADVAAAPADDDALDAADDPRVKRLLAAIERLPDRHREALRLHLQGVTLSEIGASFGVTKERARQLVARAKEMVFRALRAGGAS
jgi:RNA polymerase sigma factor (sigma-70 family)